MNNKFDLFALTQNPAIERVSFLTKFNSQLIIHKVNNFKIDYSNRISLLSKIDLCKFITNFNEIIDMVIFFRNTVSPIKLQRKKTFEKLPICKLLTSNFRSSNDKILNVDL